uniref:Uncharacterized protein n=1 Tax=Anguilla anguilla TaxID=7936 RepID=A0A0E9XCU8_ANGAN
MILSQKHLWHLKKLHKRREFLNRCICEVFSNHTETSKVKK